ncbi:Uncharacterized protein APZ42_013859 [Daphnia magna]|uniref:DDE-1 domain-containing protein n=1 Tax=Daphnia magna TaxID=35525 RepID=A0A162QHB8_9CRUS|nr:Uncharacterized protein APZ42_013859 [Daphnia magna]
MALAKRYHGTFIAQAPIGSIGTGNESGWMTEIAFNMFMKHFIEHTRPTPAKPILLLLDNHASHLSMEALNMAKTNGVVMLSFPPHCSHKLQPRIIVKKAPINIYDIPGIITTALPKAITPANIMSGFRVSGIMPLDRNIFAEEEEFAPSFFTDRPEADIIVAEVELDSMVPTIDDILSATGVSDELVNVIKQPYSSCFTVSPVTRTESSASSRSDKSLSTSLLEEIRPHPKAAPKKTTNKRKTRQTAILTSTPVKDAIEAEQSGSKSRIKRKLMEAEKEKKKMR